MNETRVSMEKTVERAQKMIHDLLHGGLMMKDIVSGTGVNPTTLGWIRKGRTEKIAERTFDRIWDYWSEQAPPKDERGSAGEVPDSTKTISAASKEALKKSRKTAEKTKKVEPKVTPPRRQKRPERTYDGFVSRQHVPIDAEVFTTVIDRLIDRFEAAKKELEGVRKEIG